MHRQRKKLPSRKMRILKRCHSHSREILGQDMFKTMNAMIDFHDKSRQYHMYCTWFYPLATSVAWGMMMTFLQSTLILIISIMNKRPACEYWEWNSLIPNRVRTKGLSKMTSSGLYSTRERKWISKGIYCQIDCPTNLMVVTLLNPSFTHPNLMTKTTFSMI